MMYVVYIRQHKHTSLIATIKLNIPCMAKLVLFAITRAATRESSGPWFFPTKRSISHSVFKTMCYVYIFCALHILCITLHTTRFEDRPHGDEPPVLTPAHTTQSPLIKAQCSSI